MKLYSIKLKTGNKSETTYEPIRAHSFKRALWIAREFTHLKPGCGELLDWEEVNNRDWEESEIITDKTPSYIASQSNNKKP